MFKEKPLRYSRKYNKRKNNNNQNVNIHNNINNNETCTKIAPEISNVMLTRDSFSDNFIHIEEEFDDVTPFMKQLGDIDDRVTNPFLSSYSSGYKYYSISGIVNMLFDAFNSFQDWLDKKVNNPVCLRSVIIIFLFASVAIYVSVILLVTSFDKPNKNQSKIFITKEPMLVEHYTVEDLVASTAIANEKSEVSDTSLLQQVVTIPENIIKNLADVNTPMKDTDLPVLWHIPRSGGTSVKIASFKCLDLVLAAEFGGEGHTNDTSVEIVELEAPKGRFINLDVSTVEGLERAKSLGLASSQKAQLLVSRLLYNMVDIFDETNQGRMFAFFRHPNDIIVSIYQTMAQVQDNAMSLQAYLESKQVPESWIVRQLSGNLRVALTNDDLNIAKAILEQKFLIGLIDDTSTSFQRFVKYFHWDATDTELKCMEDMWLGKSESIVTDYKNDTAILGILDRLNAYDISLFEYAQELFIKQGEDLV